MKMHRLLSAFSSLGIACLLVIPSLGQTVTAPPRPVTENRKILAISYPEGMEIKVDLQGTYRLPMAQGAAEVTRKKGTTKIEMNIHDMKPAYLFGGDYSTYVLWTVSPEGVVDNAGEFILEDDHSKLHVTTPLETFAVFVTAEPHFLVRSPSRFVVLENTRPAHELSGNILKFSDIQYHGFEGVYEYDRETLANAEKIKGEIRPDLREASVALKLAIQARAETYARPELDRARASYERTQTAVMQNRDLKDVMLMGHEAIRLAVEAQKLAEQRRLQAASAVGDRR